MADLLDLKHPAEPILVQLFEKYYKETCLSIEQLAISGSNRAYFRLKSPQYCAIGTHSPDQKESAAFISFTQHFTGKGLAVPTILAMDLEVDCYLQEDLGDDALYHHLPQEGESFSIPLIFLYKNILEELAKMQILGRIGID